MGNDGAVVPAGEAWGWSAESGSASIVAADKAIEFRILKQGRAIGGKEAESADPGFMAGAEFAVTGVFAGSTEESTDVMTVGIDGWTEGWSSLLVAGNIYKISETRAPLGYKLIAEPLNVMLKTDGTLVAVDAEGNALMRMPVRRLDRVGRYRGHCADNCRRRAYQRDAFQSIRRGRPGTCRCRIRP